MIFLTVGSQKFHFNRLLEEMDRLVLNETVKAHEVFAQTGYSSYRPKTFLYKDFLDKEEFIRMLNDNEIIITHGGTGTIITSIKKGKKVIGVPRSVEFGEHVDNHQYEIINQFFKCNMIYGIYNINDLADAILNVKKMTFKPYKSETENIINIIEQYIDRSIF